MTTPTLPEQDFMRPDPSKSALPYWVWGFIFTTFVALAWGMSSWYFNRLESDVAASPFLQVTNRQLSVFLWEYPEHLRANTKQKTGYLPGFKSLDDFTLYPEQADEYVMAPPELLLLYHTWDRLLRSEFSEREIATSEFREFLEKVPEWQPEFWHDAPRGYREFVQGISSFTGPSLNGLSTAVLPLDVRMAFQGWKNYFKEGPQINALKVNYQALAAFLQKHPHYTRNYWRNFLLDSSPSYLINFTKGAYQPTDEVPSSEFAPFLRVALFNSLKT